MRQDIGNLNRRKTVVGKFRAAFKHPTNSSLFNTLMNLNFFRFYWLRLIGAILTIGLAVTYLSGREEISLTGFALLAVVISFYGIKIRKGTMPALCDLCGSQSTMKAEYGAGFSNARLVVTCPRCGRVINRGTGTIKPERE